MELEKYAKYPQPIEPKKNSDHTGKGRKCILVKTNATNNMAICGVYLSSMIFCMYPLNAVSSTTPVTKAAKNINEMLVKIGIDFNAVNNWTCCKGTTARK